MGRAESRGDGDPAVAEFERVVGVCDRFEAQWRSGEQPRIEEFLARHPSVSRPALLRELLALELELARAEGAVPTAGDYRARFPDCTGVVEAAFAETTPGPANRRTRPGRSRVDTGHNLLFGVLVLQNNFISRGDLLAAFATWVTDKTRPLAQLLVDRGALDDTRRMLLEVLVAEHLKQHGGDPEASLAAVRSLGSVRDDLERLNDLGLQASLAAANSRGEGEGGDADTPLRRGVELTVSLEPAPSTDLAKIAQSIGGVPHIVLRDTETGTVSGPIPGPCSPEMSQTAERHDKYELFGEIARGGMGAVLRGRDMNLGRDLAVKVLLETHKDKPELVKRFVEEAQIGGQLQHPGVVPVYELGSFADSRPFFTMKLVKGRTLAELLRARAGRGSPDPAPAHDDLPRFLSIFEAVCQTMAYAHARGVIHRDLKPSNVMVGSFGEVQVMDWGLAKVLPRGGVTDDQLEPRGEPEDPVSAIHTTRSASDADASQAGSVLGTSGYMAPEQARGEIEAIDERADVFGLGAILCEILTGEPAFVGRNSGEALRKAGRGELSATFARLEGCGAEAELISLAKDCLAPEREDRPRRAGVASERLTAYLTGVQDRLRQAELARAEERARRRLTMAVAASVLALLIVGGGGWAYLQQLKAARRAAVERAVTSALDEANMLRGQARSAAVGELSGWSEALSAARRAEGLLAAGEAGETTQARVRTTLASLEQERAGAQAKADALRRDRDLLTRIGSIQSSMSEHFDPKRADAELAAAFRDFGVDLDRLDPKEAGQRLRGRSAPTELAWFLDSWALLRSKTGRAEPDWRRLVEAARAVDPDPWRDAVRATVGRRDAAAAATLRKLADDEQGLEAQPATSLIILASQLQDGIGDQARGESVLRRAWRLKPADFFVNFLLGASLMNESVPVKDLASRRAEAVRYLTAAVAIRPGSAVPHANLGIALDRQGKRAEAIDAYRAALRLKPDLDWVHNQIGNTLRGQGKPAEALAEYRAAIRLRPEEAGYHSNLGDTLLEQGKPAEALDAYRVVLRLLPDKAVPHYKLAAALSAQGKRDEAMAEYRAALRLKPDLDWVHNQIGNTLRGQGKPAEALAEYRAAIRLRPEEAGYHSNLGDTLLEQGKPAEALDAYRVVLRLLPDKAVPHYKLAAALSAQGKRDEAMAEYRAAIQLEADDAGTHNVLAWAMSLPPDQPPGQYDEAAEHARKAVALASKEANFHNTLALAEYRCGHWDESIVAAERSMALRQGGNAWDWFFLAMALGRKGEKDKAVVWFDKAVAATKEKAPQDAELRQFWTEAAKLLGRTGPEAKCP